MHRAVAQKDVVPTRRSAAAALLCAAIWALIGGAADAQTAERPTQTLSLTSMESYAGPGWRIVGDVHARRPGAPLETTTGTGVLFFDGSGPGVLRTSLEHGDLELALEFMLEDESCAAVLLQSRFELSLCGHRSTSAPPELESGRVAHGSSVDLQPQQNAARAPGTWQHLWLDFRSPRIDENGRRIANARLERVVLNGVTIHRAVDIPAATMRPDADDALAFAGGSSGIAFRNVYYESFGTEEGRGIRRHPITSEEGERRAEPIPPISVEPDERPYILRNYVRHDERKKLNGVYVGDPSDVHYSLDLDQAALLYVWRGPFLNLGPVWTGRGMEPDSRMLDEPEIVGSRIAFSGTPTVAFLSGPDQAWPDTVDNTYRLLGYRLDDAGRPTFRYRLGGAEIKDRFIPDGSDLVREITISGDAGTTAWVRLADGDRIEPRGERVYSVDDRFFLEISSKGDPAVRSVNGRDELLVEVPLTTDPSVITSTMIW